MYPLKNTLKIWSKNAINMKTEDPPDVVTTPNTPSKEYENDFASMFSGHLVNAPGATCLGP
jgi:hypothetical protein